MKLITKIGTLAATGALAVAMPAAAHPGAGGSHPSHSHKCQSHNRAYVESGTVDSTTASTLAQNSDGTWSGTLVVDVTRADRAAKADRGQTVTYTFTNADLRVSFGGGTTGFTGGERVKLIGKIAATAKKCTAPSTAATPVFKRIRVHPALSSSSGSDTSGSDSSTS